MKKTAKKRIRSKRKEVTPLPKKIGLIQFKTVRVFRIEADKTRVLTTSLKALLRAVRYHALVLERHIKISSFYMLKEEYDAYPELKSWKKAKRVKD